MTENLVEGRLETIKDALSRQNHRAIRLMFHKLASADISEIFEHLDPVQDVVLFRLVPIPKRTETFAFINHDRQREMLDLLPDAMVVRILNELDPVDRTKLLEELPEAISERFIQMLTPKEREIAQKILSYPEESVGRIMTPEFMAIRLGLSASQALEQIRWRAGSLSEHLLYNIFVVDSEGVYVGHLTLGALITADPPRMLIDEIVQKNQPGLSVLADEGEAVDAFRKYDETCIPVTDEAGILVGVVEADDVFDLAEEEATEEMQQFGGHDPLEDSYFQTPIKDLVQKRAGWLAVLFVGMMFTADALEYFDESIKKWSYLVFFVPLIISSGGNSGSQAASLMIRGLAVKEIEIGHWFKIFKRELLIGVLLGGILGVLGFLRASLYNGPVVGLVTATSLVGIVVFGTLIGSMLPFIMKRIGIDPAVSSSPVIASLVDFAGIIIFFKVAIFYLQTMGLEGGF